MGCSPVLRASVSACRSLPGNVLRTPSCLTSDLGNRGRSTTRRSAGRTTSDGRRSWRNAGVPPGQGGPTRVWTRAPPRLCEVRRWSARTGQH